MTVTVRSQRIARSIENATPRDINRLVEFIGRNLGENIKYTLHQRLLQYANEHYDLPEKGE